MRLSFLGACHEVTGSCFFLRACGKQILVDCGLQQGPDEYDNQTLDITPSEIDYVLLTHAHIDHSGRLPLLYARGFRGEVHATSATADLCEIMLRDSAHIQMFEAEWQNRKAKRAGKQKSEPLYQMEDAEGILSHFTPHEYSEMVDLCPGLALRFVDVGHLLGSSSIELWVTENGTLKKLVFSGDIGNTNQPLIRDPQYVREADYVVMESTYGDRNHKSNPDYVGRLSDIIQSTFERGGNVVIPSFAVGRTQELLYFIRQLKAEGRIKGFPDFSVYVDSPLAVEATNIFNENRMGYFDEEAMALVNQGINPIGFSGLKVSVTSEDSKQINFDPKPKVIISASGMCEAGRIKHHLKHNLWRKECTVLFVGYQGAGTLGRALMEGADRVKLFGEEIEVQAHIERFEGISGHADRQGLIRWLRAIAKKPKKVFVVHGEDSVCSLFADFLKDEYGYDAEAPLYGAEYDLLQGAWLKAGERREEREKKPVTAHRVSNVYLRLLNAGKRLMTVIHHNEGGANKDLGKFADQINALCDKWDR